MRKAWKVFIACSPLDTRYWFDSVKFCSITFQWTAVMNKKENLILEIDNMKIQAGMERWPTSQSIQE